MSFKFFLGAQAILNCFCRYTAKKALCLPCFGVPASASIAGVGAPLGNPLARAPTPGARLLGLPLSR
ncbi:MAG TPA: hypothetical protein DCZ76_09995 [Treponema sp.]|nr:hypothetical protein [Treponema sp.]